MKVVINKCHGGFGLSKKAYEFMGIEWDGWGHGRDIPRSNSKLVECVSKLGAEASGSCADLQIIEIPDDVEWQIEEYDGMEWVAEKHRTWE